MEEVLELADRITVLRDGRAVGDLEGDVATHETVVALMVGRELSRHFFPARKEGPNGDAVFTARDVMVPGAPAPISFSVRRGEILGFAGLVGAGRTELMQTIFGVTPAQSGAMTLGGVPFAPAKPRDAIVAGVFLVPEDRKRHGLVLPMSVAENTTLPNVGRLARWGTLDRLAERRIADTQAVRLHIKTATMLQEVVGLSGGNQQKVVLAKWLAHEPSRAHARRADTRHRRSRKSGDLSGDCLAGRKRDRHPAGQLGTGGSDRPLRSRRSCSARDASAAP